MAYPYITDVNICADVPISPGGTDQLYFDGQDALTAAILSKSVYHFANMSYQRIKNSVPGGKPANKIIVPINADTLLAQNCNYITFKNQELEKFRIFAYITDIGYDGENSASIIYEVDYFTTYIQQASIKSCRVEREHVSDDTPGHNTEAEPLSIDYYEEYFKYSFSAESTTSFLIFVVDDEKLPTLEYLPNPIINGEFCSLKCFKTSNPSTAITAIKEISSATGSDSIKGVLQISDNMTYTETPSNQNLNAGEIYPAVFDNGFVPKNKKMFTYPYRYYNLLSSEGDSVELLPQNFKTGQSTIQANRKRIGATNAQEIVTITNYNAMYWDSKITRTMGTNSSFTAGVFDNMIIAQMIGNTAKNTVSGLGSLALGNVKEGANQIIGNTAGLFIDEFTAQQYRVNPGTFSVSSNLFNVLYGFSELRTKECNLNKCKVIDDFFSMYGYAVNLVKVPNLNSRPSWNYVKTVNSIITGNIPTQAKEAIRARFDAGVRLWHTMDVGNYTLANEV